MKAIRLLVLYTLSFAGGFMVWVLIGALLPFIREAIPLTPTQAAWAVSTPVILGSLLRVPLGYLAGRFGARWTFTLTFLFLLVPVWALSRAHSFAHLLLAGLFLGVAGAVFSVGVTALPKYFPPARHGLVNGLYGMGNAGSALTTFFAPLLAAAMGWRGVVGLALLLLLLLALANLFLADPKEPLNPEPLGRALGAVRRPSLWALSLLYFVTFGAFVAFTNFLPGFLVSAFGLPKPEAGLKTAGFILLATLARPLGGWLSDRYGAHRVLLLVFLGLAASGVYLSLVRGLEAFGVGVLAVALLAGLGNGAVFKLVPATFPREELGLANGFIGMWGGLGGFFPPLVLAYTHALVGHYAVGFMALSAFALANAVVVLWLRYGRLEPKRL